MLLRYLLPALVLLCGAVLGGESLRVMSFNVRYGTAKDGDNHWDKRKDLAIGRIAAFKPDILGLQEALKFQNEYILEKHTNLKMLGVAREDGKDKGEFATLMYNAERLDVVESGTFWLSETPDVAGSKSWDSSLPRVATWARFKDKKEGKEFLAINTHFDHKGTVARVEAAKMIRKVATEKWKGIAVIVTGDFNSAPDSIAHKALVEKQDERVDLFDTYATFFKEKPEADTSSFHGFKVGAVTTRIDWILTSEQLTTSEAAIDRYREGNLFPSDHFPIWAVVKWK